jgi:hypothetical protein
VPLVADVAALVSAVEVAVGAGVLAATVEGADAFSGFAHAKTTRTSRKINLRSGIGQTS